MRGVPEVHALDVEGFQFTLESDLVGDEHREKEGAHPLGQLREGQRHASAQTGRETLEVRAPPCHDCITIHELHEPDGPRRCSVSQQALIPRRAARIDRAVAIEAHPLSDPVGHISEPPFELSPAPVGLEPSVHEVEGLHGGGAPRRAS